MRIDGREVHASITEDRVMAAADDQMFGLENPGFCVACGAEAEGCEPDARKYRCESCGERAVYGAQELVLMLVA
jgi:DNA-directed RNA polymerase subunit RPC12/RpoP